MAAFSNYLEDQITGWLNGTAFASAPTNTYVQLYSGNPTDAGTGGTAKFGRIAVSAGGWTRSTGGAGTLTNTAQILITSSAGTSETVDYVAVWDASTGGNLLFYGALAASLSVNAGDEVRFNASGLQLTVA
jgi:hypothetical protein